MRFAKVSRMPTVDQLSAQLDRLAAFEPGPFPVISLYLNLQPDQTGRDNYGPFLRKELADRLRTFSANGPERDSLEKDAEKIRAYVEQVDPAANGLAVFASSGADLFDAIPLAAPIDDNRLFVSDQPHLYPLARLIDEYPRYAVLLADTNSARVFVVAGNAIERTEQVEGVKTRRHKMGGWSQARYQRHTENFHVHHAKEVADALGRVVRDESINSIVLAGDEVIVPLLRDQLPKELTDKIIDVVKLDIRAPEREVLDASIAALRGQDVKEDRDTVDQLIGAYRANGLAVVGIDETRKALEMGQVDELVIASPPPDERAADELVAKARQTAATIRIIQDPAVLATVGGVGALLRFKV
jgi:peptide subunit release factor 1 (eRF1)